MPKSRRLELLHAETLPARAAAEALPGERLLLHDRAAYATASVTLGDSVPVTVTGPVRAVEALVAPAAAPAGPPQPLLLSVYGAYGTRRRRRCWPVRCALTHRAQRVCWRAMRPGVTTDAGYREDAVALLARGVMVATAHVRYGRGRNVG